MRLFRYSYDVAMFGECKEDVIAMCDALSSEFRMAKWEPLTSFLGAEIEYVENLAIGRQTAKISEAITKFSTLI